MKSMSEYERKFGLTSKFVDDFEKENAGLASHQVAQSYAAKQPPLQGKKRSPIISASASIAKGRDDAEYVILGKSDARWPDRGPPGAVAPRTGYRLKASRGAPPHHSRIIGATSEPQRTKHHMKCKAKSGKKKARSAAPLDLANPSEMGASGLARMAIPGTRRAAATLPLSASPSPAPVTALPPPRPSEGPPSEEALPDTKINRTLRKKAGLPASSLGGGGGGAGNVRSERLFESEYNREFVPKSLEAAPLHSPIMNAEKFYKGSIDLTHFPTDLGGEGDASDGGLRKQPLTEYRKQFPPLPTSAYSRVLSPNLNFNNNNENDDDGANDGALANDDCSYDIISHLPHGACSTTAAAPEKTEESPDPLSAPMSPPGVDFLVRASLPVPHVRPSSTSAFSTEYRRSFRPFDAFKYVDGAFKEEREADADKHSNKSASSSSPPLPSSPPPTGDSWFAEVLELREKAAKYKDRFTTDRFTEIRKQTEKAVEDVEEEDERPGGDVAVDGGGGYERVGEGAESVVPGNPAPVGGDDDGDEAPVTSASAVVVDDGDDDDDDDEVTRLKKVFSAHSAVKSLPNPNLSLHLDDDDEKVDDAAANESLSSSISTLTEKEQVLLSERDHLPAGPSPVSRHSLCDCGASIRSSSSASSIVAPPLSLPPTSSGDPRATYRNSHLGAKKRLKPNFVPPTIRESMAETYTKPPVNACVEPTVDLPSDGVVDSHLPPRASRSVPPTTEAVSKSRRSPSPSESVASSTASELSARSLSRAQDILQRAKDRRRQFWGE